MSTDPRQFELKRKPTSDTKQVGNLTFALRGEFPNEYWVCGDENIILEEGLTKPEKWKCFIKRTHTSGAIYAMGATPYEAIENAMEEAHKAKQRLLEQSQSLLEEARAIEETIRIIRL